MTLFQEGHALIISIANYKKLKNLSETVLKDGKDIVYTLANPRYAGYPPEQIERLVDREATADQIRHHLTMLAERAGEDETVVVYFSGHGGRIEDGPLADNYLLPYDTDPYEFRRSAIGSQELTALLKNIKAKRLVAIFDCCHAGGVAETKSPFFPRLPSFKHGLHEDVYTQLRQGSGRVIIAASRADEASLILPNMKNSIFTHYLLEALKGQAAKDGASHIRVLDVYDYISEQFEVLDVAQHPILKVEIENNFPLALAPAAKTEAETEPRSGAVEAEPSDLIIENHRHVPVPRGAEPLFWQLGSGYDRLIIQKGFDRGWSGAHVFEIRRIKNDVDETPIIVKVDAQERITAEREAFEQHIQRRMPLVAGIDDTVLAAESWGGLCYAHAGEGVFETAGLREVAAPQKIGAALRDWAFPSLRRLWAAHDRVINARLRDSYDFWLPPNLVIDCSRSVNATPLPLTPETVQAHTYPPHTNVALERFWITVVYSQNGEVELDIVPSTNTDVAAQRYRLMLQNVPNSHRFQPGERLQESIAGVVSTNRQEILRQQASRAFQNRLDVSGDSVTFDELTFPNPIAHLSTLEQKTADCYFSSIHGDLNLENVLVVQGGEHATVRLIDFARARYDATLHDFLCLETGLLVHLVAEKLEATRHPFNRLHHFLRAVRHHSQGQAAEPPSGWNDLFDLFTLVRQEAQRYLVYPHDWTAYDTGLIFYLLGILDFRSLDEEPNRPFPKQVAFWAATITNAINTTPSNRKSTLPKAELLRRTRQILRRCEIFDTDYDLRAFFGAHPELALYQARLGFERYQQGRINSTINLLQQRSHPETGQNGLVSFLLLLSETYPEIAPQLHKLAKQLDLVLINEDLWEDM